MIAARRRLVALPCLALALACTADPGEGPQLSAEDTATPATTEPAGSTSGGPVDDSTSAQATSNGTTSGPADSTGETGNRPIFDVAGPESTGDADSGCFGGECMCSFPEHVPCDEGTEDLFEAIGLNCPGEPQVSGSVDGSPDAIGLRSSFGANNVFDPREGAQYVVLSTGDISELDDETPNGDPNMNPTYCNTDVGNFDPGGSLPAPLVPQDVGNMTCTEDPSLIGTGDCSNSIQGQFEQGESAEDYAELRFSATVPMDVEAFRFDFAFFSVEWPFYEGSQFNDLFVGWLESEQWTGNISFDGMGNPISLNASFFQLTDNGGNLPEFDGTCMRRHGGSDWLSTTASVTPGEDMTMVFAIFDLSDSILDSFVFLDNWQWGCVPTGGPVTEPAG